MAHLARDVAMLGKPISQKNKRTYASFCLFLMMPETFEQSTNKDEQPLLITMLWQRVYALSIMLVGNGFNYYCLPVVSREGGWLGCTCQCTACKHVGHNHCSWHSDWQIDYTMSQYMVLGLLATHRAQSQGCFITGFTTAMHVSIETDKLYPR